MSETLSPYLPQTFSELKVFNTDNLQAEELLLQIRAYFLDRLRGQAFNERIDLTSAQLEAARKLEIVTRIPDFIDHLSLVKPLSGIQWLRVATYLELCEGVCQLRSPQTPLEKFTPVIYINLMLGDLSERFREDDSVYLTTLLKHELEHAVDDILHGPFPTTKIERYLSNNHYLWLISYWLLFSALSLSQDERFDFIIVGLLVYLSVYAVASMVYYKKFD